MIKGLAEVVQNQQILQNTAMKETTAQLKQLSETVATLTQSLPPAGPTGTSLRLPNLVLPKIDFQDFKMADAGPLNMRF